MVQEIVFKRISQLLLIVGPAASLVVSPWTNYDPINLIKILFVSSTAFSTLFLFLSIANSAFTRLSPNIWIFSVFFVLSMLSTIIFSGAPLSQQIWGTFGRNTGLITYLALLILLISAALIQKTDFYNKLVWSLLITSIPMTIYCVMQSMDLDPINWNEKLPFGTLGNINFSSAFFGISSICAAALIIEKKVSFGVKVGLSLLVVIDMFIVLATGSIQGFMIFVFGIGILIYLRFRDNYRYRFLKVPYTLIVFFGIVVTIFGLSNKGPLAKFLFQPSVVYRTDYWHAGWQMTLDHPFTGVGLDSYGDWYRSARGMVSTLRTGPDRIANTAHNIFLDISSSGGFPMITAYLLLNIFAFNSAIRMFRRKRDYDGYFAAIFSSWIGYLIFSAVSINQIGVGIWGWLFTGSLIGYEISTRGLDNNGSLTPKHHTKSKKRKTSTLPASAGVFGLIGFLIGFTLAFIPFNADIKFRAALNSKNLTNLIDSTKLLGSTSYHREIALDTAISNKYQAEAKAISDSLISDYPRSYMGWKGRWYLNPNSNLEKREAILKMHELDPFNPEIPKS